MITRYVLCWFLLAFIAIANGILRLGKYGKLVSELTAHQVSTATGDGLGLRFLHSIYPSQIIWADIQVIFWGNRIVPGQYPDKIKSLPLYDGQFDAHKLTAEGADVLFASYPAGTDIPSHTHDTDNWGVITRGELIITIGGEEKRISTGGWYHVPAHEPHSARFEVETDEIEFWFEADKS